MVKDTSSFVEFLYGLFEQEGMFLVHEVTREQTLRLAQNVWKGA
jgi:hypothetical protein